MAERRIKDEKLWRQEKQTIHQIGICNVCRYICEGEHCCRDKWRIFVMLENKDDNIGVINNTASLCNVPSGEDRK